MSAAARLNNKAGAMVFCGLLFWVMAWVIDMWTHVETFGINEGAHAHGGSAMLRVNIPVTGVPLVLFGLGLIIGTERLMTRGGVPLLLASFFLMTDGLMHAFALNDHLGNLTSAAFFAFVAPLQVAAGIALPFIGRRYDHFLLVGTVALLLLYAVSRAGSFGPLGWPEPVEALDVVSKACEVLFALSLIAVMRAAQRVPKANDRAPAPAAPRAAEP